MQWFSQQEILLCKYKCLPYSLPDLSIFKTFSDDKVSVADIPTMLMTTILFFPHDVFEGFSSTVVNRFPNDNFFLLPH